MRKILAGLCVVFGLGSTSIGQILPPGATPQLLTGGYRFTEGPLYDHAGGLYFSDLDMTHTVSRIYHYDIASHTATLVDPDSGGTNGTYFNASAQIVACERDRRQMALRSSSNVATVQQVLATNWQGALFNGPNDVVVDAAGGMYFTDPDYENRQSVAEATYYLSNSGVLSRVITGIVRPNGIVLSPNGKTLYLSAWSAKAIRAYDVTSPGVLANGRNFVTGLPSGPDGITIDPIGNLYASLTTKVRAWSPAGQQLMDLSIPQSSTNVEIGGATGKTLFITAGTGVYGIDLNVPPVVSAWGVNNNGNWSANSNWTGELVPNGVDHTATFGSTITAPKIVTADGARTVGSISFDNANSYTIAGSTVTLDVSTGQSTITVASGSHTISAPLVLNDNTTFTVNSAGGTLTIAGNLIATGKAITKSGAGTVQLENLRAASLNITAGKLRISSTGTPNGASGTSVLTSDTIASGAQLDLTNNSLIVDYGASIGTLVNDMRVNLLNGRLTSSLATATLSLGYANNAGLGFTHFAGQDVGASSFLVKFTYKGDSNLDGVVDISDLGNLATSYGTSSGAIWTQGDSNYDSAVDVSDLGLLATNYQSPPMAMTSAIAAVPEPTMLWLIPASALVVRRRRRF